MTSLGYEQYTFLLSLSLFCFFGLSHLPSTCQRQGFKSPRIRTHYTSDIKSLLSTPAKLPTNFKLCTVSKSYTRLEKETNSEKKPAQNRFSSVVVGAWGRSLVFKVYNSRRLIKKRKKRKRKIVVGEIVCSSALLLPPPPPLLPLGSLEKWEHNETGLYL